MVRLRLCSTEVSITMSNPAIFSQRNLEQIVLLFEKQKIANEQFEEAIKAIIFRIAQIEVRLDRLENPNEC